MNDIERARQQRMLRTSSVPVFGLTVPVSGRATITNGRETREIDVEAGDQILMPADPAAPLLVPSITIRYDVP